MQSRERVREAAEEKKRDAERCVVAVTSLLRSCSDGDVQVSSARREEGEIAAAAGTAKGRREANGICRLLRLWLWLNMSIFVPPLASLSLYCVPVLVLDPVLLHLRSAQLERSAAELVEAQQLFQHAVKEREESKKHSAALSSQVRYSFCCQ